MQLLPDEIRYEIFQFHFLEQENQRLKNENSSLKFYHHHQKSFYYISFTFFLISCYVLFPFSLMVFVI